MNPSTAVNPKVVNPNKALWEKGDFTEIAAFMRQSGEAVVQSLAITPPLRVLDLAAEMAPRRFRWPEPERRYWESTSPEPGGSREQARRASGSWQAEVSGRRRMQSGRCHRPFVRSGGFDLWRDVCAQPLDVAKEMVRVTKPGGRIVMAIGYPAIQPSYRRC